MMMARGKSGLGAHRPGTPPTVPQVATPRQRAAPGSLMRQTHNKDINTSTAGTIRTSDDLRMSRQHRGLIRIQGGG